MFPPPPSFFSFIFPHRKSQKVRFLTLPLYIYIYYLSLLGVFFFVFFTPPNPPGFLFKVKEKKKRKMMRRGRREEREGEIDLTYTLTHTYIHIQIDRHTYIYKHMYIHIDVFTVLDCRVLKVFFFSLNHHLRKESVPPPSLSLFLSLSLCSRNRILNRDTTNHVSNPHSRPPLSLMYVCIPILIFKLIIFLHFHHQKKKV